RDEQDEPDREGEGAEHRRPRWQERRQRGGLGLFVDESGRRTACQRDSRRAHRRRDAACGFAGAARGMGIARTSVGRPRKREAIMPRKAISTIDRPLFAVFLLVLGATGIGCMSAAVPAEQEKATTDVTALPQEVRTALDRAARVYAQPLNGARWSEVYVLKAS